MINSHDQLRTLLGDTSLAGNRATSVPAGSDKSTAFVIEVTGDAVTAWRELRERISESGRWPVLTLLQPFNRHSWDEQVRSTDIFSRFYYLDERKEGRTGDTPEAIVAAATTTDAINAVSEMPEDNSLTLVDCLSICKESTKARFGKTPKILDSVDFLAKHSLKSQKSIERWFFDWELANCDEPLRFDQEELGYLNWYQPSHEPIALVLLPTTENWESLAYINWFASQGSNSQTLVALLRHWHSRYRAELVAHYGTMLQLIACDRPQSPEDAFELAWQQHTIAQCTTILPGVSPRDHARALLRTERWFLHQRP
ncbi:MAG: DUF4253 domain-containing protein [Rhodanobacteraceae bacterium]|nr:DUF4253 domain-containing protein [Rhodanobacteraceae bacterium]